MIGVNLVGFVLTLIFFPSTDLSTGCRLTNFLLVFDQLLSLLFLGWELHRPLETGLQLLTYILHICICLTLFVVTLGSAYPNGYPCLNHLVTLLLPTLNSTLNFTCFIIILISTYHDQRDRMSEPQAEPPEPQVEALHLYLQCLQTIQPPLSEICSICLEPFDHHIVVKEFIICKHQFHGECIFRWLKEKQTCPNCRIPISF